ncbi:MAG TPA: hypothetical protein VHV31_02205, partial [Nitrolancea sp.]|nr:hypothetical protein [Nitrolancea sp.]
YADAERVFAYYTATGLPSLSTAESSATDLCPARLSFTPAPSGTSIDASGAAVDGNTLECYVEEPADSTPMGSLMTTTLSMADGSASVTAQVPVQPARVAEPHETSEVNGHSVTLNRVMVTPSGLLVDFSSPDAGPGGWSASFNGWNPEVDSWGSEITSGPPYACACYYPGASLPGPWTIKLTHSVNTANQLGQATVAPSQTATFTVTLPPASWNQP